MSAEILRLPEVLRRTGLSRTSVWRLTKKGDFPTPVRLGERCVGWLRGELDAWLESRPRVSGNE